VSTLNDLAPDAHFQSGAICDTTRSIMLCRRCVRCHDASSSPLVIADEFVGDHATEVVLCSGKFYYELLAVRVM
jgi:hypothetical protein